MYLFMYLRPAGLLRELGHSACFSAAAGIAMSEPLFATRIYLFASAHLFIYLRPAGLLRERGHSKQRGADSARLRGLRAHEALSCPRHQRHPRGHHVLRNASLHWTSRHQVALRGSFTARRCNYSRAWAGRAFCGGWLGAAVSKQIVIRRLGEILLLRRAARASPCIAQAAPAAQGV